MTKKNSHQKSGKTGDKSREKKGSIKDNRKLLAKLLETLSRALVNVFEQVNMAMSLNQVMISSGLLPAHSPTLSKIKKNHEKLIDHKNQVIKIDSDIGMLKQFHTALLEDKQEMKKTLSLTRKALLSLKSKVQAIVVETKAFYVDLSHMHASLEARKLEVEAQGTNQDASTDLWSQNIIDHTSSRGKGPGKAKNSHRKKSGKVSDKHDEENDNVEEGDARRRQLLANIIGGAKTNATINNAYRAQLVAANQAGQLLAAAIQTGRLTVQQAQQIAAAQQLRQTLAAQQLQNIAAAHQLQQIAALHQAQKQHKVVGHQVQQNTHQQGQPRKVEATPGQKEKADKQIQHNEALKQQPSHHVSALQQLQQHQQQAVAAQHAQYQAAAAQQLQQFLVAKQLQQIAALSQAGYGGLAAQQLQHLAAARSGLMEQQLQHLAAARRAAILRATAGIQSSASDITGVTTLTGATGAGPSEQVKKQGKSTGGRKETRVSGAVHSSAGNKHE